MPSPSTFHGSVQTPCVTQFFFSEHLGATFGRNRTELGWLKLALLGTIAGGAGAFVLHWVGLVDMSWEWQTPRMHFFPIFTIKLSLYDKKTAMKNLGKDFFLASNITLEMGVSPSTRMLASHHHGKMPFTGSLLIFLQFFDFWIFERSRIQNPHVLPLFDFLDSPIFFGGPNFRGGTFHVLQRFSVLKPGLHRVFTMLNWQFVISGYSHSKLTPHQLPPFSQKRHPRCSQDMWHCSPYVGIHGVAVKKKPLCQFSVRVISKVG